MMNGHRPVPKPHSGVKPRMLPPRFRSASDLKGWCLVGDTKFAFWQRRVVIWAASFTYVVTGAYTLSYPPEYLAFARWWAVLFFVAGFIGFATVIFKKMWLSVLSGGLMVGSAFFRSGAIYTELGPGQLFHALHHSGQPMSASFAIAGTTWALIGVLLWAGWPQLQANLLREKEL
jgi:hypothetical protein